MKRFFRCTSFMLKQTVKRDKTLILLYIFVGLMRESQSLVNIFLPAAVLSLIMYPENMDIAVAAVAAVNLLLLGISVLLEKVQLDISLKSAKFINHLQCEMNRKTMRVNYAVTERKDAMDIFYKASEGLWNADDVTYMLITVILCKCVTFLITFLVFARVHILVACCVFATVLADYLINVTVNKKQYKHDSAAYVLKNQRQYVDDMLFTQKAARDMIFNSAKNFLMKKREKITGFLDKTLRKNEAIDFNESILVGLLGFIRTIIVYTIAMAQFFLGKLNLADFLLFTGSAQNMTNTLYQITNAVSYINKAAIYYQDYEAYLRLSESDREEGELPAPDKINSIEFRNVCFRYENTEEDALRDVSFELKRNETAAFVGDNGAGKSTIIKLLLRLYKVSDGDILLNGVSIYKYKYGDYLSLISPVFQDFCLYSINLRDNILCGKKADDSEVYRILEQVGLEKRISSLPLGIDTPYSKRFSDDGVVFSGGEEQKLAISRAFAKKNSHILVFDEPTASLDPLSELEINRVVSDMADSDITVFVSHRLNSVRTADKIIVLDKGTVAETGNHAELMSRASGIYRKFFDMQASYYVNSTASGCCE